MKEEDEYVVTNLDDGEKYSAGEVSKKFNVLKISNNDEKQSSKVNYGDDDEDDYFFDAKQNSFGLTTKSDVNHNPVNIPEGGRLNFFRISAVGTTKDVDEKVYSVFYLDVRCNVASPSSWFVYRRYSQFRRLSDVLRSEGYYVPVLPPKKILGAFSSDFVKQRKADLETWLYNLAEMHTTHAGAKDPQAHSFYRKFLSEDANKPPTQLTRIYPEHLEQSSRKAQPEAKKDKVSVFFTQKKMFC
jgi:hypothetical protein